MRTHDAKRGQRGQGHIYRRGRVWWIRYSVRGKRYDESSGSTRKTDAQELMRLRIGKVAWGYTSLLRRR